MSAVSLSCHEAEDDQKRECKYNKDPNTIHKQPLSVRTFFANSRINPTDHDQSLDDRASRKRLAHIATVNLIGQGCKGRNTNKEEDECNGHRDKMGDKAKSIALTKELEAEC